jgi:hypothetical protein
VQDNSWREWLLRPIAAAREILPGCPAGPCVRATATGKRPVGTWACARPVHLATAIEHLRLDRVDEDLQAAESSALLDDINRHLEGRGFRLHAQAGTVDWQLECDEPIECGSVEPELAAGRSIRDLMPGGQDGARVRSLVNEMQMLLHEHPVNQQRANRGLPAINTLWLWGFGRIAEFDEVRLPMLYTDDAWLSGVWRLNGVRSRPLGEVATGIDAGEGQVLVAGARPPRDTRSGSAIIDSLAEAERSCFAPALTALRSGAVGGVDVLLGDREYSVERSARFKFWRRVRPLAGAPA